MNDFESQHPRGHASNPGSFDTKQQTAPDAAVTLTVNKYANEEPPAIDKDLDRFLFERAILISRDGNDRTLIADTLAQDPTQARRWSGTPESRIAAAEKRIADRAPKIAELDTFITPINTEFNARGGWTRFFITKGTNAHVHSSMSCTTCYPTTEFGWLTDHSGMDEEEIVELAGDEACTVCFSTAPVADRNAPRQNRLETPDAKDARILRETTKAAKASKAAADAITSPDGGDVLDDDGYKFKTEIAAERSAMNLLGNAIFYDNHPWEDRWYRVASDVEEALANKRGVSVADIRETWVRKLTAKAKRDGSEQQWAAKKESIFASIDQHRTSKAGVEKLWSELSQKTDRDESENSQLIFLEDSLKRLRGRTKRT
jgi:hypothetical protein